MLNLAHARDLIVIAAVFGIAAFIWAGWAQEKPPKHWAWRVLLGSLSLAGLILAALTVPLTVQHWDAPTALDPSSGAFTAYLVVFGIEILLAAVLAIWAIRTRRSHLVAPLILLVVGLHFLALAAVMGQPALYLAGCLLSVVAIVAFFLPRDLVAPSFWCGLLGAPIFLTFGVWSATAGVAWLDT